MDKIKGIMGMGLAVMLMAGGASMTTVSLAQAADAPAAKQESKPSGEKKDIKQGDKPAASEDKSRGFKKGQKATETMGTMGKEKAKEETKP